MSLSFYDTLRRRVAPFVARSPDAVSIYVCGPTVNEGPHLGHARSAVVYDVLVRLLRARGRHVRLVCNVTDIDDKMVDRARAEAVDWRRLAERHLERHRRARERLRVLTPEREPRVTDFIDEIIAAVARLLEAGFAYVSQGDVYFALDSIADYGALSGRRLPSAAESAEPLSRKRRPEDFVLWKAASIGEPSWESPWGRGRPGWHIGCAVMSSACLGVPFDLHGGGEDLRFPHHENELVLLRSLSGSPAPVGAFLHHGLVCIRGRKMSKSTGPLLPLADLEERVPAGALRLLLLSVHYRRPLEVDPPRIEQSLRAHRRLLTRLSRLGVGGSRPPLSSPPAGGRLVEESLRALEEDLNTPRAIALLHAAVRDPAVQPAAPQTEEIAFVACDLLGIADRKEIASLRATPRARGPASPDLAGRRRAGGCHI